MSNTRTRIRAARSRSTGTTSSTSTSRSDWKSANVDETKILTVFHGSTARSPRHTPAVSAAAAGRKCSLLRYGKGTARFSAASSKPFGGATTRCSTNAMSPLFVEMKRSTASLALADATMLRRVSSNEKLSLVLPHAM